MRSFPDVLPHGSLTEVFPDVFFVTGTMRTEFAGVEWQFSRNMTIVREGRALTLINTVRLDAENLDDLDRLGDVINVVRIGCLHGLDDAFYIDRYRPVYWAVDGMTHESGLAPDRLLAQDAGGPFEHCGVFVFSTTQLPEAILIIEREGGIAVASDALQNWTRPDAYFSESTAERMSSIGFFQRANVGPVWKQMAQPAADDFARLQERPYRHALCGHGEPLRETAHADFGETFSRLFQAN